jgi:hypothetical protein
VYQINLETEHQNIYKPSDELCIQIHPNWFAFAIYDREKSAFISFNSELITHPSGEINDEMLKNWLFNHQKVLNLHFKSINIGIHTNKFIILPKNVTEVQEAFSVLNDFNKEKEILLCSVIDSDFYIHSSINKTIWYILINFFEKKEFYFGDYGFIKEAQFLPKDHEFLMAQIYGNDLSICHSKNGKPMFFNKFKFETKEDLLYFIVLAYKELNLDRNSIPLLLYGFIETESPLFQTLFGFIRHVRIAPSTSKQKQSILLKDLAPNYFQNLLNLIK